MKQYELPVTKPVFRLKGGSLAATVLELASVAPAALAEQLALKVAQAPQLLRHSPLIIDLDKLGDADGAVDLDGLLATCRLHGLQPVALRAHRGDDLLQAQRIGLAVLPPTRGRERMLDGGDGATGDTATAEPPASLAAGDPPVLALDSHPVSLAASALPGMTTAGSPASEAHGEPTASSGTLTGAPRATRVINQPVRSGQQVYAAGDLILLAPVSAGAEVMADGNIHCYAPLRGRALAGVQGDNDARLFCRELSAELVAIAGHYRTADDLKAETLWGRAAQLFLREGQLTLLAL